MKHIEKKILMLLSVVVLAAGCIKEDLDGREQGRVVAVCGKG